MKKNYQGREKTEYKSFMRTFERKLNKCYAIILIVGTLMVFIAILFQRERLEQMFRDALGLVNDNVDMMIIRMKEEAEFVGGALLTLFTILASFIVFYYSIIGYHNYGISNRKLIGYTYGTYFFPLITFINAIVILCFVYAYYAQLYIDFYVLGAYSVLLQAILMINCVKSTSQEKCYNTLLQIEEYQFLDICKSFEKDQVQINCSAYREQKENIQNLIIYHCDNILKGSETISEKFELIQAILKLPFHTIDKKHLEQEHYKQGAYIFVYQNMMIVGEYLKKNPDEIQQLYSLLYENINQMQKQYQLCKNNDSVKKECTQRIAICLSAIFHALIPLDIQKKYDFFVYVVNEVIRDSELRDILIMNYLGSIVFLWYKFDFELENESLIRDIEAFFKNFRISQEKSRVEETTEIEEKKEDKIKKDLMPVFKLWLRNTSRAGKIGELMYILENMEDIENDFITYLYRRLWN